MAEQFIFTMHRLNKQYGTRQVLKEISLSFYPGAKIGIVGENGSGKSTLLRIMAGLDQNFTGHAEITRGFRALMVPQEPKLEPELTVRQILEQAFAETLSQLAEFEAVSARMGEPLDDDEMQKALDRMAELQDMLDASDAWNLDQRIAEAADALCLPDDSRLAGTLSGGEKRRVALCRALLMRPDLLLLDEPTNHLDAETVHWLEAQLRDYPGTVLIVTHDRYFLDNITRWILELDRGAGVPWEGNYSSWLEQKLARLAAEEKKDSPRRRAMEHELAWIRMSGPDRADLSRARIHEYEALIARETATRDGDGSVLRIAPGPDLGDKVLEFSGVTKGYGGSPLFSDLSFAVPRGAVVGLVGPNGTGKTTLFRLAVGQDRPDAGRVELGPTVRLAYVDQERDSLPDEKPLVEAVAGGADEIAFGRRAIPVRQYLSWFGLKGADQQKKVGELSGGERNRFHLARTLRVGGNLLLLDEPTNDLDVNTLRLLEEAILDYPGNVLVISHDRFFLDRICTHLLVFEGQGQVRWFAGAWRDYEAVRQRELGGAPLANRRAKYRKIVKG